MEEEALRHHHHPPASVRSASERLLLDRVLAEMRGPSLDLSRLSLTDRDFELLLLQAEEEEQQLGEEAAATLEGSATAEKQVEYLYLNNNLLTSLPENFARTFPRLKWLDLRSNQFETLRLRRSDFDGGDDDDGGDFKHLHTILLQENPIRKLPDCLPDLRRRLRLPSLQVLQSDPQERQTTSEAETYSQRDGKDAFAIWNDGDVGGGEDLDSGVGSSIEEDGLSGGQRRLRRRQQRRPPPEAEAAIRIVRGSTRYNAASTVNSVGQRGGGGDGEGGETAGGNDETAAMDAIDRVIQQEKWTLLPDEWNSIKKAIVSGAGHDKRRNSSKWFNSSKATATRGMTPRLDSRWGPSLDLVRLTAEAERKRKERISLMTGVEKELQRAKDMEVLKTWREQYRGRAFSSSSSSTSSRERMKTQPLGLDRFRGVPRRSSFSSQSGLRGSRAHYDLLVDRLSAEIDTVLRREVGRVSLEEVKESQEEARSLVGEMGKIRAAVRRRK